MMRSFTSSIYAVLILLCLVDARHASAQVIQYPVDGNFRAESGTIELWFRIEGEPDGTQKNSLHYFPMFSFQLDEEKSPRVTFSYCTIWGPQWFHFFWSSCGRTLGEICANPYVATVDEDTKMSKADVSGGKPYPRTPRLHKGTWYYLAITWTDGLTSPTLCIYLDGKQVLLPTTVPAVWWENLDSMKFSLLAAPYHDNYSIDELRTSDVARSPEEIVAIFKSNKAPARDAHTLLLDHMDWPQPTKQKDNAGKPIVSTVAEQIAGYHGEVGGKMVNDCYEVVDEMTDGRFGSAIRITGAPRKH